MFIYIHIHTYKYIYLYTHIYICILGTEDVPERDSLHENDEDGGDYMYL
jgi:hypothetical protein